MIVSRMAKGKIKPEGTYTPASVPRKAKASENAKVRKTDGINSVDVCGYNVFHLLLSYLVRIYEDVVKMFRFFSKNLFLLLIGREFQLEALQCGPLSQPLFPLPASF